MPLNDRLALDLGTNSIGWAMLHLDMNAKPSPSPDVIIRAGVRIFGDGRDPQTGVSILWLPDEAGQSDTATCGSNGVQGRRPT